jgi:hypothetical protein
LASNAPGAHPASPDQPTHTPSALRKTGSSAVTSPPGLGRQPASPSGPSTRSTGSRLATTTNSCCPGAGGILHGRHRFNRSRGPGERSGGAEQAGKRPPILYGSGAQGPSVNGVQADAPQALSRLGAAPGTRRP